MSVEMIATPVELVVPLRAGLEFRHTPRSAFVLRLATAVIFLAATTIVMLSRPGATLVDSSQVAITGP